MVGNRPPPSRRPPYPDERRTGRPVGRPTNDLTGHPLLKKFVSADSYGLILLLVAVTYLLAVSFSTGPGHSAVMAVQIATVWMTLRTAHAPRMVRVVASVTFIGWQAWQWPTPSHP